MPNRSSRSARSPYDVESLESRRLMSTYVINGGAGGDIWHMEAVAGQVFVNGQTINNPAITDVQINGNGGEDLVVVNSASIPVVFNGGAGNDWISLTSGIMSGQITAPLTFNAGTETDFVELRDEIWPVYGNYSFGGGLAQNQIIRWGSGNGSLSFNGAETVQLNTGTAGSSINFDPDSWQSINTTITGGNGSDSLFVDYSTLQSNLTFDARAGQDTLQVDDRPTTGFGSGYAITPTSISHPGRGTVFYNQLLESMDFVGSETTARTYHVADGTSATQIFLTGGNANDVFDFPATGWGFAYVNGGGGLDSLSVDDRVGGMQPFRAFLAPTLLTRDGGSASVYIRTELQYASIESAAYLGANATHEINIYGTSADIPSTHQWSVICGAGDDTVTVYPRDASGNLTINGNIGIGGGAGVDRITVDDSASATPSTYTFYNPFGAGTQNIAGVGSAGFGIGSDVEAITLTGTAGNDVYNIDSYKSGIGLTINAGLGDDVCNFGNGDVAANVTSIASFLFNGMEGTDTFNLRNANPANSFTYTAAANTTLQVSRAFPSSYFVSLEYYNTEQKVIWAGPAVDILNITSFASGELSFHGAGGDDALNLPTNSDLLGRRVNFYGDAGTANRINQITNSKTVPTTLHVSQNTIGAFPGDSFFAPGGSVFFDSVQVVQLRMGNGADTAYMQPDAVAAISINGGNPATAPGDTLNLALASAADYVVNGTPASGNVTSSNLKTLSYSGFETGPNIDDVSPAVVNADINLDGIAGFAEGTLRRQSLDVQFSEDVSALLSPVSLQLTNLTTNEPIPAGSIAVEYDAASNLAHFTFPGYANGILPDGNYEGRILAGLPDFFGNALPADAPFNFFFLNGDANHDGTVNLADFNILATNFGTSGNTFSQADFNYDGSVNLQDFNILASRFGQSVGPSPFGSIRIAAKAPAGLIDRLRQDLLA